MRTPLRIPVFSKSRPSTKPPETELQRAHRTRDAGDIWGAFTILRAEYEKQRSEEIATELSSLIGTSSRYVDVLSAMESHFDNNFYLNSNPDVRGATKDGDIHYLLYGWKENRNPSPFFDNAFYRDRNADLKPGEFLLSHFAKRGNATGSRANPVSDHYWFEPFSPTDEQWSKLSAATINDDTEAVVIIPVYKGYEETMTSIYHAVSSRGNDRYSLLVINDRSPDDAINATLRSLAAKGLFEYHASVINRGFVQTCNYAIKELSGNHDVVLLNSDAYVFPGWFNRLKAHAIDPTVATVTPLSNNATICSYPLAHRDNFLALECTPEQLDALAANANRGLAVETPTGVGFCFYMSRNAINKIGALDSDAFKVGYGEENDFCMRALNHGYKNLIVGDVFVFHTGSVSFSAIKEENFNKGQKALEVNHPNYSPLVRGHIMADPELHLRRRLDMERLSAALCGATVFVTHKWGGGINTYLKQQIEALKKKKSNFVTLQVHDGCRITVNTGYGLFVPNLANIDLRNEFGLVAEMIYKLSPKLFHVNSFAGIDWHWHKKLLELISESGIPYKYVGHDYSSISHHYQLLRPDNIYVPIPSIQERRAWSTMIENSGSIDICDPDERLEAYTDFLEKAAAVEVPSKAANAILAREFPRVTFNVVPHDDHLPDFPIATRRAKDKRIKVAVIGAIGPHKGSDVLTALAVDAKNRNLELVYTLVGYSSNDDLLRSHGVSITGPYHTEAEALDILSRTQPDFVLIPSIWPETFCYALSMALKLLIPPVVFDIGAQAERVSPLAWGVTLPISLAYAPRKLSETLLGIDIDKLWDAREGRIAA